MTRMEGGESICLTSKHEDGTETVKNKDSTVKQSGCLYPPVPQHSPPPPRLPQHSPPHTRLGWTTNPRERLACWLINCQTLTSSVTGEERRGLSPSHTAQGDLPSAPPPPLPRLSSCQTAGPPLPCQDWHVCSASLTRLAGRGAPGITIQSWVQPGPQNEGYEVV